MTNNSLRHTNTVWASELETPLLFAFYDLEKKGLIHSKMERKNDVRYERKFYLGKQSGDSV